MQVENYIIILGLAKHPDTLDIKYRILPDVAAASIVIRNADRTTIKSFSKLQPIHDGLISFSTKDLPKGTYTCTSLIGIQEGLTLNFSID